QGLVKTAEQRALTDSELIALALFVRATTPTDSLYIAPPTANVLQHLVRYPHYAPLIQLFLKRVEVIEPTRYVKRWARRLRDYGFTREDGAMLALGSFATNSEGSIIGMNYLATFDQPMINQWDHQQDGIQLRLQAMQRDLEPPYVHVTLPQVLRPDHVP
ncbi:MAG: hypothetical protein KDE19_04285, partial [Caldilineaceae bacterium]|nr:hypothetical protein [Caldilineaceae bacterium]